MIFIPTTLRGKGMLYSLNSINRYKVPIHGLDRDYQPCPPLLYERREFKREWIWSCVFWIFIKFATTTLEPVNYNNFGLFCEFFSKNVCTMVHLFLNRDPTIKFFFYLKWFCAAKYIKDKLSIFLYLQKNEIPSLWILNIFISDFLQTFILT